MRVATSSAPRESKLNQLAFYAVAYGGSAALQKGAGFLLFIWLARSLSVEEYATFGLLLALQTGLAAVAGGGIVESVVGLLKNCETDSERHQLFDSANGTFAVLALAAVAITGTTSVFVVDFVGASISDLVCVTAGGIVTAFVTIQANLTRLEEDHGGSLALSFFPPMAGWVAAFVSFSIWHTVSAFFSGLAVGLATCLLVLRLAHVGFYDFAVSLQRTKPIFARITPFILIVVLVWLSGYGNTYLVKSFFSTIEVARFTFAYTLAAVMQLVATSLNQVWSPRFFRMVHAVPLDDVERAGRRFFLLQGLALGMIGGLVLAVVPLVTKLAGRGLDAYQDLDTELLLLFAAYAVSIPWYHVQNYYFAHGKGKELLRITLTTTFVGMLAWVAAMWSLGAIGAYMGFVLLMGTRMLGTLLWARREWSIGIHYEGPTLAMLLLTAGSIASAPLATLVQ